MAWSTPRTWATSEVVTAAHMNQEVRDNLNAVFPNEETVTTWAAVLRGVTTDPVPGTTGHQYKIGALQFLWARFVFGGSGGSGIYSVDLPETAVGVVASATQAGTVIGNWTLSDTSATSASEQGVVTLYTSTSARFRRNVGTGTDRWVSSSVPINIATDDVLTLDIHYPYA